MEPSDIKRILQGIIERESQTYIGMRYVPVFADSVVWDPAIEYEPLTMVTYDGVIYVSKFYVPIGVQIDNSDFWITWGDVPAYIPTVPISNEEIDAITEGSDNG